MTIRKKAAAVMAAFLFLLGTLAVPQVARAQSVQFQHKIAGEYYPPAYNQWRAGITVGSTGTGSQTITVAPMFVTATDGYIFSPFSVMVPLTFDDASGTNAETVTPTAVTCNASGGGQVGGTCNITATFTYAHGAAQNNVRSGTYGLADAQVDAFNAGGGQVLVDNSWGGGQQPIDGFLPPTGGTTTFAPVALGSVSFTDKRFGATQYWNVGPANTTALAVPSALTAQAACDATHTFCSDSTVAGSASWGGAVYGCVSYVDIMGNESVCSTTANFTSVASKAIDVGAPAASAGAVGYRVYLSVSGGSYALAYSVPLLKQPTVLGQAPVTTGYCTLSQPLLQIGVAACSLTNATYGTTSSNMVFTGYPVVTSQLAPNLDSASAQSLNPNYSAVTKAAYLPSARVGIPGVVTAPMSFPITTAAQSTIGQAAGSIRLPFNFMNHPGREIQVCGLLEKTSTTADTITNIQLWWDAEGSNVTAGTAVQLSNIQITQTLTAAPSWSFCQNIQTTVAAATATGGTIVPGNGWLTESQVAAGTIHMAAANSLFAAVGSLNLALPATLEIVYNHTTGTDGSGVTLINPTITVVN